MFSVIVETEKKAEKRTGRRAYLARINPNGREFSPKILNTRNRRAFKMAAQPGDVFEARRFWWGSKGDAGGTTWFMIDGTGNVRSLTRYEAISAAISLKIAGTRSFNVDVATRVPPKFVWCQRDS